MIVICESIYHSFKLTDNNITNATITGILVLAHVQHQSLMFPWTSSIYLGSMSSDQVV